MSTITPARRSTFRPAPTGMPPVPRRIAVVTPARRRAYNRNRFVAVWSARFERNSHLLSGLCGALVATTLVCVMAAMIWDLI